MKQYLLFDLDGTLTDPMVGITSSVQYALEKFGIHVKYLKDLIPFIGPPLDDSFQEFYGLSKEDAGKAVEYYREYFAPKGIFENEVYPGIPEMLSRLVEAGFTLIVATSKPAVFAKQILEHFGLSDYFSFVGGSELDGTRKRKAEVIGYILETCEIKPQDAIMIGDRKHDIEGAKLCGLESVGVLYGYGSEEELSKAGADHIIKDVKLLEEYLRKQGENPDNLTWYDRLKGRTGGEGKETKMIRFGMIGTGKIAQKFWQANRYGKDFELTAVYSRTLERAREFGFQKGRLQYFDDLEAFANSDCIDAVYVASPNCCHHDQVMTLLKAGKHVLCEKPMASNLKEAEEMFAEAEKQNLILLEGMRSIYAPSFEKMLPYMESLGKIRRATLQYCQYSSRYDNYKRGIIENAFKPELSNGALMDIGVYVVACMIRLFGAPVSIKASGIKLSNGVDGAGTILMEYPDMIGEAIYSKITDSAMPSQIQGEDASMLVQEIENIKDLRIVRKGVVQSIHFEQSDNILNYETQEFIKMIKTGMGWEKSREITLETMKVLDEARRQLHIVFPADGKSQEKKKQKKRGFRLPPLYSKILNQRLIIPSPFALAFGHYRLNFIIKKLLEILGTLCKVLFVIGYRKLSPTHRFQPFKESVHIIYALPIFQAKSRLFFALLRVLRVGVLFLNSPYFLEILPNFTTEAKSQIRESITNKGAQFLPLIKHQVAFLFIVPIAPTKIKVSFLRENIFHQIACSIF